MVPFEVTSTDNQSQFWQSLVPMPIVITIYMMLSLPSHYIFIWWLVVAGAGGGTLDPGSLRLITASWHQRNHQGPHVVIKLALILLHLFGAEFGLEILLDLGKDFFTTFC